MQPLSRLVPAHLKCACRCRIGVSLSLLLCSGRAHGPKCCTIQEQRRRNGMMPCAVADKPDVDPFCGAGVKGMTALLGKGSSAFPLATVRDIPRQVPCPGRQERHTAGRRARNLPTSCPFTLPCLSFLPVSGNPKGHKRGLIQRCASGMAIFSRRTLSEAVTGLRVR